MHTGQQTAWNKLLYVGREELQYGWFARHFTPRWQFEAGEKIAWGMEEVRRGLEQSGTMIKLIPLDILGASHKSPWKNKHERRLPFANIYIRLWSDTCKRRGDVAIDFLQSGLRCLRTTGYAPPCIRRLLPRTSGNQNQTVLPKWHDNSGGYQNKDNVSVTWPLLILHSRIPGWIWRGTR